MKKLSVIALAVVMVLTMCFSSSMQAFAYVEGEVRPDSTPEPQIGGELKYVYANRNWKCIDPTVYPENFQHGTLLRPNTANNDSTTDAVVNNNKVFWDFNKKTGTLTISGTGPMNDYEFDDLEKAYEYSGSKKQHRIPWQNYRYAIKKVVVKTGITHIGNYAFGYLDALKTVEFADSVKDIGEGSFAYSGLEKIKIPNGVKVIQMMAFTGCTFLKKVDLNNVEDIRQAAFEKCAMLNSIVIPETLKELSSGNTFGNTHNIKFKGNKPPKLTPYIWADGREEMGFLTTLGGQTIYIPESADSKDFMKEISKTEYWDKKTWSFVEYDDEPLIKAANEVSASLKVSKLKKGFKVTVSSKDDVLKSMGKEGASCIARYKFYRSTRKNSGYKLVKETTSPVFKNTKVKKGKRYYYKAEVTISIVTGGVIFGDEEGEDIRTIKLSPKRA